MKIFFKTLVGLLQIFNIFSTVYSWDRPKDARPGQFPHLVSIEWSNPPISPARHLCGGVVLDKKWILSSGYCMTHFTVGSVVLKVGRHDIANDDDHVQTVNVVKKFVHYKYPGTNHLYNLGAYDFCLVKVHPAITCNDRVKIAKLPKKSTLFKSQKLDYNLIVAGWGSPTHIIYPNHTKILQTMQVPVVENKICNIALGHVFHNFRLDDSQMCTRPFSGSMGACIGDYGGALFQYNKKNEVVIIGIRAYSTSNCNTNNLPPIYSKVSSGLSWIKRTMKNNS